MFIERLTTVNVPNLTQMLNRLNTIGIKVP